MARRAAIIALLGLLLLTSCDQVGRWRDGQIATSNRLAQSGAVTPPEQPVDVPSGLRADLPLHDDWTILSYSSTGGSEVRALTTADTAQVTMYILRRLHELGYETGDNASRILEGTTYTRRDRTLYVHVTLNTADQTLITLRVEQ